MRYIHGVQLWKKNLNQTITNRYWYGPSFYADVLKAYFNCTETEISHDEFAKRYFDNNRIFYINFDEFHIKHFWHHALYSWSPIMETVFKEGNYE